jgi:hypothetical protein
MEGIKVVKMYAWEPVYKSLLSDFRNKELSNTNSISLLEAGMHFFLSGIGLSNLLTIATYVYLGNELTPEIVFGVFVLIQLSMNTCCTHTTAGMTFFIMLKAGSERISDVLSLPEQNIERILESPPGVMLKIDKLIASWSIEPKSDDADSKKGTAATTKSSSKLLNNKRKGSFKISGEQAPKTKAPVIRMAP